MFKKTMLILMGLLFITSSFAAEDLDKAKLDKILPQFEQYAQKSMKDWQVPGMSIVIVQGDKVVYIKSFGVKKIGTQEPVDVNTVFQIGSISKSFTAALGAVLVDQGKIKWKDEVIDYYPGFITSDPVVTREFMFQDLFAQDSGLPAHIGDTQAILGYSADQILNALRYYKPEASFRSEFAYQNIFFVAASRVMQNITHKDWTTLLNENIFGPLEMKSSTTTSAALDSAPDHAALHQTQNGKVVALAPNYEGKEFIYTMGPGGGINSNIKDMANYLILMLNNGKFKDKQIISPDNLHYMWSPKTIVKEMGGRWSFYGLGWVYTQNNPSPIIWHNGASLGHKAVIAFSPDQKIGIVVLSNLQSTQMPDAVAMEFLDMVMGNPNQDWSARMLKSQLQAQKNTAQLSQEENLSITKREKTVSAGESTSLPLENYVGIYNNPVYGNIDIKADGKKLYMIIGPNKTRMDIEPLFRDIFRLHWAGAGDDLDSGNDKVRFVVDTDGQAKLINIEFFKDAAGGFFKRVS